MFDSTTVFIKSKAKLSLAVTFFVLAACAHQVSKPAPSESRIIPTPEPMMQSQGPIHHAKRARYAGLKRGKFDHHRLAKHKKTSRSHVAVIGHVKDTNRNEPVVKLRPQTALPLGLQNSAPAIETAASSAGFWTRARGLAGFGIIVLGVIGLFLIAPKAKDERKSKKSRRLIYN